MTELYSKVAQPKEIRRNLLINSKNIIEHLKSIEEFKQFKEEKVAEILKLKKSTTELAVLVQKLKAKLPPMPSEKEFDSHETIRVETPVEIPKTPKSTLEMIEDELAKLEKSLGGM